MTLLLSDGNLIDGRQAEYGRVRFADNSMYLAPAGVSDEELLMLADILPTGYEVGVLNGAVRPGDVVAVVGSGPIGLSVIMGARLFSPSHVVAIDLADARLEAAKRFGADITVNNGREDPVGIISSLTGGLGADVTVEAVDANSTPTLLRLLASHQIDTSRFITHRFGLGEFAEAYDVFARAGDTGALKVVLSNG